MENTYMDSELTKKLVAEGEHRGFVGGMWDEIGKLQFEYLKSKGLKRDQKLLDVGCGSLRGGVHFVKYLEAKNYFGFDLNWSLIEAGLNIEIANLGLSHKIEPKNFSIAPNFKYPVRWPSMDMALALSVLTHLNYDSTSICLKNTAKILKNDGRFYATIFLCSENNYETSIKQCEDVITHPSKDPYHYTSCLIERAASEAGLRLIDIEDFGHPRNQKMSIFERI